jgi:hypothetical protein
MDIRAQRELRQKTRISLPAGPDVDATKPENAKGSVLLRVERSALLEIEAAAAAARDRARKRGERNWEIRPGMSRRQWRGWTGGLLLMAREYMAMIDKAGRRGRMTGLPARARAGTGGAAGT